MSGSRSSIFAEHPSLCAHRGLGSGEVDGHRENTLESFLACVDAGLDWVEVDLRVTADDVVVCAHFPTTDDGRFIVEIPAAETDAAGIMRLSDLLEALPARIGVDLDIKSAVEDALRAAPATTAATLGRQIRPEVGRRPLLFTSFDPSALLIAQELAPGVPAGLLTWARVPLRKAVPAAKHLGFQALAAHVGSFSGPNENDRAPFFREAAWTIDLAHRAGLDVMSWCPTGDALTTLTEAGVDCHVVNDAARALRQLRGDGDSAQEAPASAAAGPRPSSP
jgi:glycerophosphoryl diester phosphodiesterase